MPPLVRRLVSLLLLGLVATPAVPAQTPTLPDGTREAHAEVPGARLFYVDTGGTGPTVVLLHAGTGSVRMWAHQFAPLRAAGFRVVAYDRRGYGRTTVSPDAPAATAADDLEGLVSSLRLDRVHLLGTAAGGIVAFDYALSFPHRLRSLIVANSLGGVTDESYVELGRRLRPKEFSALPPDFRELGPAYRAENPDGTRRWLELEGMSRASGPAAAAQPPKNLVTFARLETLRVPTLLITGGADLYTPAPALRLFADRLPSSESLVVPDVGHSAYWEVPDVFNRAVLAFIARH